LFTEKDIKEGQNVWQSMGEQEVGSVWGHGAYVSPDWTADWLHRECVWILNTWAQAQHYYSLFTNDPKLANLRDAYAIHENSIKNPNLVPSLNALGD
jgi:nitric oxide reductase subunit B